MDGLAAAVLRRAIARRLERLGVRRDDLLRDAAFGELQTLDEVYRAEVVHLWDYVDFLLLLLQHQDAQLADLRARLDALKRS